MGETRVYWDVENLPLLPHGPSHGEEGGPDCCLASVDHLSSETRAACSRAGWTLVDTPSKNGKQSADAKIVMDILTLGKKDDVVLISGDGDFVPLLLHLSEKREKEERTGKKGEKKERQRSERFRKAAGRAVSVGMIQEWKRSNHPLVLYRQIQRQEEET
mgnify:CR=1 FL=1